MKAKNIQSTLKSKVKKWLDSIEDTDLRDYISTRIIVTGGSIASLLLGEDVNDFDVYFTDKESALRAANYYVAKFKELHPDISKDFLVLDGDQCPEGYKSQYGVKPGRVIVVVQSSGVADGDGSITSVESLNAADEGPDKKTEEEKDTYRPRYITSNAITLSDKVQIVLRFYGNPEQIHENFDFQHCTSYWTSKDNELVLNPKALECLLTKELKYIGSKYPLCSVIRLRKFIKRGFHINSGEILKICYQVADLDLNDVSVLADQLVGVDSAYFSELIADLRAAKEKDPEFEVSYGYLAKIVDKIF